MMIMMMIMMMIIVIIVTKVSDMYATSKASRAPRGDHSSASMAAFFLGVEGGTAEAPHIIS